MENADWKRLKEKQLWSNCKHKKINIKKDWHNNKMHLQVRPVFSVTPSEPQPHSCGDLLSRLCLCIDIGINILSPKWKVLAKPPTALSELWTSEVNYIMLDYPYLNLSVPALYLETLAINKGRETASSQRFSYFGSLAEGEGGDGACVEYMNNAMSHPILSPSPFDHWVCGLEATVALLACTKKAGQIRVDMWLWEYPLITPAPTVSPLMA